MLDGIIVVGIVLLIVVSGCAMCPAINWKLRKR